MKPSFAATDSTRSITSGACFVTPWASSAPRPSADGIDARFAHGGTLTFARSEIQAQRLEKEIDRARALDIGPDDLAWLDPDELAAHGTVAKALGATYSPHCARIDPARLVRGLSDVVEGLGAMIFEQTAVTRIIPARSGRRAEVVTVGANVHADFVVRATEGFTPTLPGERRTVAPLYSLMIATEPLSKDFWNEYGFNDYATFADDRHLIIYGQRTSDDRIAFGGRGAPYHFGSSVEKRFDRTPRSLACSKRRCVNSSRRWTPRSLTDGADLSPCRATTRPSFE
jgi:glycine/D-amino acid oxidase-like deaminating enzyme